MKDYYKILGLERGAGKDEIKKAFRKLAAQYHPDKKTGDEAKYKEITEAYAVLGDDKKRAEYESYGHAFPGAGGPGGGAGAGFGGFDFSQFQQGAGGFEFDLNDIFEGFGFGGGGGRQRARGRDISIDLNLSFKESVFGVSRNVLITKNSTCSRCKGTGAKEGTEKISCNTCSGNGRIRETRQSPLGNFSTVRECNVCGGSGSVPKDPCGQCAGSGVARAQEDININVPAGIQSGEVIRMTGRGEAVSNGEPGDLYIKIHVENHQTITRSGTTLQTELPVKLTDALLGSTYRVETLDGAVEIKIPAGVSHGEQLRIKGKGVPIDSRRGDFMVRVKIETPKRLSRKAKQLIEQLRNEGI